MALTIFDNQSAQVNRASCWLEHFAIVSEHVAPFFNPFVVIAGLDPAIHLSVEDQ